MELVHLDNVYTVSVAFLISQLTTESTNIPCPLCGSGDCGEGISLVYVPKVGQLKPELTPVFSHYRCLMCSSTFISHLSIFNIFPNLSGFGTASYMRLSGLPEGKSNTYKTH